MRVREDESLRRWIIYVYKDDRCPCEYEYKSLGRGFGSGWARLTTDPSCPHHGTARLAVHGG